MTRSLDPTGKGQARWITRWKPALNAFAITFAEAGENTFPQAATSTQDGVFDAADVLGAASVDRFASLVDVAGAAALASDLIGRVNSSLDSLQRMAGLNGLVDIAGDIVRGASSIAGRLSTLIRTPETLALQLQGLYQQLGQAIKRPKSAIADLRAEYGSHDPAPWTAPVGSASPPQGATSARRVANAAAMEEFTRTQVIATQARILTDAIEAKEVSTAQDARDQADVVLEEIDHELEAYDPPAQMAAALIALRVAIVRDVAQQADRLQQRATYTTQAILPALLIAQRVYQDGSRADELVTRNQVRNPLFVPAGDLEVLR